MPAAAPPATAPDVLAALEDKEMTLAELRQLVDDKAIGRAWAGGFIEFGQPNYCIQGAGSNEHSCLIYEGGVSWGGPKTQLHKNFANLLKDNVMPVCGRYERADLPMLKKTDPRTGHETFHRPMVSQNDAQKLIGLRVRLTDKGLAEME